MRKFWPLAAALTLGLVGPLPAQFSVTNLSARNGTAAANTSVPTIGLPQMMPAYPLRQTMSNPFNGSKTFSFSQLLPNLSYLKNSMFPPRVPTFQQPTTLTPGTVQRKK